MSFNIVNFLVLSTASQPSYRSGKGRGETLGNEFVGLFAYLSELGYLKDSNAAAHSADSDTFYAVRFTCEFQDLH